MRDPLPFHQDGYVFFELRHSRLVVFEPPDEGGLYVLPGFRPGVHCLPVAAITRAGPSQRRTKPGQVISVDSAQMFFIDAEYRRAFTQAFQPSLGSQPNCGYFTALRQSIGTAFGYLVAGTEESEVFRGDGSYLIDPRRIRRLDDSSPLPRSVSPDPYLRVARRMHTFVCVACFREELMCEDTPAKCADAAKRAGWLVTSEPSEFGSFSVYGPLCAAARPRGA